jgi:hypothetical protein
MKGKVLVIMTRTFFMCFRWLPCRNERNLFLFFRFAQGLEMADAFFAKPGLFS